MSADSLPITPTRFAAALRDLPVSSLHLKVLELRNSIAHLDYSNEQLRPFAEGTATALSPNTQQQAQGGAQQPQPQPDQDCVDAIKENEQVIERMQERIRLVRHEVESRGLSWTEFQSQAEREEAEQEQAENSNINNNEHGRQQTSASSGEDSGSNMVDGDVVNGAITATAVNGEPVQRRHHSAWSDGTFQTGVLRNGVVHLDGVAGSRQPAAGRGQGGSLTDEELRRRMEEQLRDLGEDEEEDGEGGLHL
ncbi:hypothetical protein N657DRAFT_638577 [Parathielavia appendiculata]|uniref:Secondary alcohol dehydrogenase n=1 Tax=Parathielavia appendiculata TaxID=2587402 RepID=A0AAN6Z858_9PEZI|nr:hypothetical protein N657DRAFT_638577 [Parathielavia appendiculata]